MHSGGAQAVIRNNRKLLKKRVPTHKRYRKIRSLSDEQYKRSPVDNLLTLSASERNNYGRKQRKKHRLEFIVILVVVLVALVLGILTLINSETIIPEDPVVTRSLTVSNIPVISYSTNKALTQEQILERDFKAYVDFGDMFVEQGRHTKALKMYTTALKLKPDNTFLKEAIKNVYLEYKAVKKYTTSLPYMPE